MENNQNFRFLYWLQGYYGILGAMTLAFGYRKFFLLNVAFLDSKINAKNYGVAILFSLLAVCLLAAMQPTKSLWRRLSFLFFLLFEIHYNNVGADTHLFQFWLWSSFVLALIPSPQNSADFDWYQTHLKKGIQYAIGMILLFYSMSGFWKLVGAIDQMILGQPHFFTSNGLVYHIYSEILRAGARPLLKDLVLQNREFNVVLSIMVVLIQLTAVIGIFKPRFHRSIGFLLLLFHLGTSLILDISYPTNCFLIIWALILSPFSKSPELANNLRSK